MLPFEAHGDHDGAVPSLHQSLPLVCTWTTTLGILSQVTVERGLKNLHDLFEAFKTQFFSVIIWIGSREANFVWMSCSFYL